MRVDFHQHVWPDEFRQALERRVEAPRLRGRRLLLPQGGGFDVTPDAYSPEARLRELDSAGLDAAVVSLAPTTEPTADLAELWNDSALRLAAASGGRLIPLAYGVARPGFAGTIVAAPDLLTPSAGPELFDRLEQLGQLLFVHPGPVAAIEPAWWAAGVSYTAQLQAAYAAWIASEAARRPNLRVVFGLLAGGAAFQIERLVRRGLDPQLPFPPNVWFETSSYGERALELSFQTFGAGRLLFGSDAPIDPVTGALAAIQGFGPALEAQLLSANPSAILASEAVRWAA